MLCACSLNLVEVNDKFQIESNKNRLIARPLLGPLTFLVAIKYKFVTSSFRHHCFHEVLLAVLDLIGQLAW